MLMNGARPQTCEEEAGLVDPDVTRECRLCYAPVPNTAFATYCPNCKVALRCLHCGAPIIEGPVCARDSPETPAPLRRVLRPDARLHGNDPNMVL